MRFFNHNKNSLSVLVVDDNPMILAVEKAIFTRAGCHVITANNAFEALNSLNSSIDLVLTDIEMPEMNGDELASIIYRDLPHIPIVGITSMSRDEMDRIDQQYFARLLEKPLSAEKCFALVEMSKKQQLINDATEFQQIKCS